MARAASVLREVLTGKQSRRYGALPKIALPGDNELLIGFYRELGVVLGNKGIFRRSDVIVIIHPNPDRRELLPLTAKAFRSWVENHCVPYKLKVDKKTDCFVEVLHSMPLDVADCCLHSPTFWEGIPPIERIHPTPLPVIRPDGSIALLPPGYDSATRTFTFPPP